MEPGKILESCVAAANRRPTLRLGSHGDMVRDWQMLMQSEMHAPINPTGFFDGPTQAATRAFQRTKGLTPDGVVATKTWTAGAVAPCYALALAAAKAKAPPKKKHWWERSAVATRGLGDLSFSTVDTKSLALGAVLGLGVGVVLFWRK